MRKISLIILGLGWGAYTESRAADVSIHTVIFGDKQLLVTGIPVAKARPVSAQAEQFQIAVMPFHMKSYSETIPCDSCHRLSPNGFEFFLENYLVNMVDTLFSGSALVPKATLIAPHHEALETQEFELMPFLDGLQLPFQEWFAGYAQPWHYLPEGGKVPDSAAAKLRALGALLGASHLMLPMQVEAHVKPKSRNRHVGNLSYSFHLVLWNVVSGRPEWVVRYKEEMRGVDLDKSLEPRLNRNLRSHLQILPQKIASRRTVPPG